MCVAVFENGRRERKALHASSSGALERRLVVVLGSRSRSEMV